MSVQTQLDRINNEVGEQTALLTQIVSALRGKTAGAGSIDTLTVRFIVGANSVNTYQVSYSTINASGVVTANNTTINTAGSTHVINNVICNSAVVVYSSLPSTVDVEGTAQILYQSNSSANNPSISVIQVQDYKAGYATLDIYI